MDAKKLFLGAGALLLVFAAAVLVTQTDLQKPAVHEPAQSAGPAEGSFLPTVDGKTMPPNHDQLAEVSAIRKRLQDNPNDTEHWIQLGNILFDAGKFDEAAEPYRTALNQKPENNDVRTDFAVCLFNLGQFPNAVSELERVIASNPNHMTALFNLGVVHSHMDHKDKAKFYWNKVIAMDPNSEFAQKAKQSMERL